MKIQKCVQANELEAPIERVRYATLSEENRLPRLLDHAPISQIGSIPRRIASGE
jgi:hypothetical protein